MKKQLLVVLLALVLAFSMVSLIACVDPEPTKYTLTYAAGDGTGTAPAQESYEAGATVTIKANPFTAPEGKEFDGWSDGTNKYQANGTLTMPAANVTLTAQWKTSTVTPQPETWTVTFKNGDTVVATEKVEKGQKLTASQIPSLTAPEGKVFEGWFNGETKIDENATISADITATAKLVDKQPKPEAPAITDEVNALILHESELASGAKIEGEMLLYADGTGIINIVNAKMGLAIIEEAEITYSIDSEGVFKILTVSGAKITVPATGSVVGNTVSITIENTSATGNKVQYKFESEVYKLTINYGFEIEEGVSVVEQYIPVGTTDDFTQIEREGYTLKAIKVNGEALSSLNDAKELAMPAADLEISYVWEEIQKVNYTVTYKAGEGVGDDYVVTVDSATYKLISTSIGRTKFSREGYVLAGWIVNGVDKSADSTITLTGDTVITARWNKKYTITFEGIDASGVSTNINDKWPADGIYTSSTIFYMPYAAPQLGNLAYISRPGFTLTGWTSSADNGTENEGHIYAPGENYTLSQDTTFTAVWKSNSSAPVTTFNGQWVSAEGLNITSADLEIKEITIDGTSVTGDITGELTINGNTATMTVATIAYTLTLNDDVLTISANRLNTTYTGEFTKFVATDKTLSDYQGHWIGTLAIRNNPCTHIVITQTAVTLYAEYEPFPVTITLTEDKTGSKLVATGEGGNSLNPIKVTLTFNGDNQLTVLYVNNSYNTSYNQTVTGTFTKTPTYNVTFSLGDGVEGAAPESQQIIQGIGSQKATKPADPVREGYAFLGWFNGEATTSFDFTADITANVMLTAKWEQITQVTVTFNINNQYATGLTAPAAQTFDYDTAATAPEALELTGWIFGGWATSASSKTAFDFTTTIKSDTTLYAIWSKAYTVTYSVNGVEETKQNVSSTASELFYDVTEGFPQGYTLFIGWKANLQGDTVIHYAGEGEFVKADVNEITLTAVFGKLYSKLVYGRPSSTLGYVVRNDVNQFADKDEVNEADSWIDFTLVNEFDETYWEYTDYMGATVRIRITDNYYETPDMMSTYSFATNDKAATLTFDGFGHAKIGEHTFSYTYEYMYYDLTFTLVVSEDIKYEDILVYNEYDTESKKNIDKIDARIEIGDDTYLFGNAPEKWTVTFELGEGVTGEAPEAITVLSGNANITLPDGTGLTNANEALEFKGWTDKNGDGTTVLKGTYTVTGNITLVSVWGEAGGVSLTLADFIGTSAATAVNYGYSSLDEASTNKLDVTNSSGSLYDLFKLQFYSNFSGNVTGNRYHGANKSAGITLYATQNTSGDKASSTSSADDTYYISVSGIWCSIVFEKNAEGVRSIIVTNLSTNATVTWTEIVSE